MHLEKLQGHLPDSIYQSLPDLCTKFDIDGPLRLSHILGQASEETGSFTVFTENLDYSAEALQKLFPRHFLNDDEDDYARQPEKIANRIYANRMGNGDEASGDGYKFRGRGSLQTTGRSNYKALGDFLGVDLISNPELVATDYCMDSAAFFFKNGNLWHICDKGIDVATITIVTQHVNGGQINIARRIQYTQEFYKILTT